MTTTIAPTQTSAVSPAAARTGAHVRLAGIRMVFGHEARAVEHADLDIQPGQFVTLLGASGSGKTTLLRIIAGFQRPTSGQVVIDDVEVNRVPVHKRGIGMVFQNYALFPHMSVEKNVRFPLAMANVPKQERAALVAEALVRVHLSSFAHRMPSELSGGQQQRVALARAIVGKPRLVLMDEPLGALDRRLRGDLQIEIRRLSKELGLTVVNVTHDQEEALTMSDRIALLIDGRIAQYGTPDELYHRPASAAVASFLGESNLFSGTVCESDRGPVLEVEGGSVLVPCGADAEPTATGADATVLVRPNEVQIVGGDAVAQIAPDTCWVPAKVAATLFAGDSRKVVLRAQSGRELVVRLEPGRPDVSDGDSVMLTWSSSRAVTLARTAA